MEIFRKSRVQETTQKFIEFSVILRTDPNFMNIHPKEQFGFLLFHF